MYAKYFTVYFRRTIKFDARVANLILYRVYQKKFAVGKSLLIQRGLNV